MERKLYACLAVVVISLFSVLAPTPTSGQSTTGSFVFRSGQSMYIVAFRRYHTQVVVDPLKGTVATSENINLELGAESKVRDRIEEWRFFKVSDKPSGSDFVFLVSLDDNSMEGLAVPFDAYNRHFKEKFDLDALRDSAYGRYLAGPLKLASEGRLSDRLVKDFRLKLEKGGRAGK